MTQESKFRAPRRLTSSLLAPFPGNKVQIFPVLDLGIILSLPVSGLPPSSVSWVCRGWAEDSTSRAKMPPRGRFEMCGGILGVSQLQGTAPVVLKVGSRPA